MQKTVVLGSGESGFGAALLAHKHGHRVFVSDAGKIKEDRKNTFLEKNIAFEEGNVFFQKTLHSRKANNTLLS